MSFFEALKDNLAPFLVALAAVGLSLQKLVNVFKSDRLDGRALDRLGTAERKIEELSNKVHEHAIALTQAQMMIIQMHGLMVHHETPIPESVLAYIKELQDKMHKVAA